MLNKRHVMYIRYLFITAIALSLIVTVSIQLKSNTLPIINAAESGKKLTNKDESTGTISSIQKLKGDSPAWVLSGHWNTNIFNKTLGDFNTNTQSKFDATISMVLLNGSSKHQHRISNFSITDVTNENNMMSYKGLATVTMKDGPVSDVRTEIKLLNHNVISVWFDPAIVKNHFGISPIYGVVLGQEGNE